MHDDVAEAVLRALRGPGRPPKRLLLTGWFSFRDGEATAGDVLAQQHMSAALTGAGVRHETAWSPGFRPGALSLETADPRAYDTLLFVCGPVYGSQVAALHGRFRFCRRLAAGVSVVDPADPAVAGFHAVVARDGTAAPARRDLAADAPAGPLPPVAGVVLSHGQGEYGARRRHGEVTDRITGWLAGKDCARVPADTRLATDDWRLCATAEQFLALVARLDLVVTTRLHGLVLGLRTGTPVIAVDPVAGGAKLSAQARALDWPALVAADALNPDILDHWWEWALSGAGRTAAACHSMR
ncbi:polysaccharide pyruvyl transferase family protein [Streptomyces sp. MC1]|uniref:polysaccharide pyruvyl transferase family protein n=1 Tax=Streptomyces sp. MC1 TaxID=295105 RepID=UPI0018CA552C|nr:polysaccharide pyruvyl transferase family protein [Streptomyces sp. MC1]MBG7696868.1 polysaccharide pyruvyl transferase family protein [Streptomyces sp. MC1]